MEVPRHIAIIMDGNGRWAKSRGFPRIAGHKVGADSLKEIVKVCAEIGVKYLTVYAFSTENWKRPKDEVSFLMGLLADTIEKEAESLGKNNVRLRFLGRLKGFSGDLQNKMQSVMAKLDKNTGLNLVVMVNYGGRAEIVDAVNEIIRDRRDGKGAGWSGRDVEEQDISRNLYTKDIPDPDLLIRTASEMRISNFMLWQIAYSEIYVTDVYWPEFRRAELLKAIENYNKRERRFGKTSEQII